MTYATDIATFRAKVDADLVILDGNPAYWYSSQVGATPINSLQGYNKSESTAGLLDLFEATGDTSYLQRVVDWNNQYIAGGTDIDGDSYLDWIAQPNDGVYHSASGQWYNKNHHEWRAAGGMGRTLEVLVNNPQLTQFDAHKAALISFLGTHMWDKWWNHPTLTGQYTWSTYFRGRWCYTALGMHMATGEQKYLDYLNDDGYPGGMAAVTEHMVDQFYDAATDSYGCPGLLPGTNTQAEYDQWVPIDISHLGDAWELLSRCYDNGYDLGGYLTQQFMDRVTNRITNVFFAGAGWTDNQDGTGAIDSHDFGIHNGPFTRFGLYDAALYAKHRDWALVNTDNNFNAEHRAMIWGGLARVAKLLEANSGGTPTPSTYDYQHPTDLTAEMARTPDLVITQDSDWNNVNSNSNQTIHVAPGDWSHIDISLATEGTSAASKKIIRAQTISGPVAGIGHHPHHLPSNQRTIFPTVSGNFNCNNLIISGFVFPDSITCDPWPRDLTYNNGIIFDRYMMENQTVAGGGVIYFKYQARDCVRQFGYYNNNCDGGEGAAGATGSELGGEIYTGIRDIGHEIIDHNQALQWVQQQGNLSNPSDMSGYIAEHVVYKLTESKRTNQSGTTVGVTGNYSPYECGFAELKSAAADSNNKARIIDGLMIGARNCNDVGANQSQVSGIKHPQGDSFSDLKNVIFDGFTAIDCNFFMQLYDGNCTGSEFRNITGYQCGKFATDNGNYLDDIDALIQLRNLGSSNVLENLRLVDCHSGAYVERQGSGYSETGTVVGTAASVGGYTKYVYDAPITDPESYISIPGGSAFYMQEPGGGSGNSAPVLHNPGSVTVIAGASTTVQFVATDADNDSLTYAFDNTPESWITLNESNGLVSVDPGVAVPDGNYAISVRAFDGTVNSNIVTVNVTVTSDELTFATDIKGTTPPHDAGFPITHVGARTVTTGGGVYRTDWFGHYWFITASGDQSSQFAGEVTLRNSLGGSYPWNGTNKTGLRGFAPKLRWDWICNGDGQHTGAGVAQLDNHYDYCDANGFICWPDLTDMNFGLSSSDATASKSFAPTFIESAGGAMVSGNPSNIAAGAKLHVEWVMDKFVETLLFLHNRYKNRPSYVGFTVPETTRSEHNGGSLTNGSNYQNISSGMFTQYKRMVTNWRAGAPGGLLKPQCNYMGSYLDQFIEHCDAVGGIIIGTPDCLPWKSVDAYDNIRDKRGIMGVHIHWETRELAGSTDDPWDFSFVDSNALHPQAITHFSYNKNNTNWQSDTLSKLQAENWFVNQTIPSDLGQGGSTTTTGTNPSYSIVSFNGSTLNIQPKPSTTANDIDTFSIWSGDDEYTATVPFYDSDPGNTNAGSDGQKTTYDFFKWKPSAADIIEGGVPNWEESTDFPGYTGSHHLKATGGYNAGTQDDYRNGDSFTYDTANLPPGNWWIIPRGRAFDTGSDSFWLEIEGVPMPNGSDQYWYDKSGNWTYQYLQDPTIGIGTTTGKVPRTFSNTDGLLTFRVREQDFAIDYFMIVQAGETNPPTGEDGYYSFTWPGTSTVTSPDNETVLEGQGIELDFIFDIDPLINNWNAQLPLSSDNVAFERTTASSAPVPGSDTKYSLKGYFVANTAGEYTVEAKIISGTDELVGTSTITVLDPLTAEWPQGVSATLPATRTVTLDGQFTIDPDPQNVPGHVLNSDRWSVSNPNLSIVSSTVDIATFRAAAIGTSMITYRMERADNPADPVIYTVAVTITAPTTIMPDEFTVKNNQVGVELDVLANDAQTRITSFPDTTDNNNGTIRLNAAGDKLLYDPEPGGISTETFTYFADDGSGGNLDSATVTLQVVEPLSFDATVKLSIGPNRAGIRGNTFPFEAFVVRNEENYGILPVWGEGFTADGRVIAVWKDGISTGWKVAIEISSEDVNLEEIINNIWVDATPL